ncbi:MAG: DUF2141 domain-containing protein [Crocinitomicaceae bacterium]
MGKLISLIVFGSIFLAPLQQEETEKCTLTVELSNIRNNEGSLFIFLYNYENQFPDNPFKYFEIKKENVSNNRMLVNIPNMDKGKYAISLIDDENNNADLDRFLGIPTEGYGFSNNVKPLLSLPNYNDLLFDLNQNWLRLNLKLQYVL